MKDECRSVMAALSVNVLTVYMFLSVVFLPGVWAECNGPSFLHITAPKKLEALSGSCLIIPCSFTTKQGNGQKFDNKIEIIGVWIKNSVNFVENPDNVIFNSSKKENIFPMNITGNLKQQNCTTLFSNLTTNYTENYFFRIENGKFKAHDFCNIEIKIQDSPQSPSIEIPADLKEEASVSITCSAPTPCPHSPPELTWNLQPDFQRQTETNTDGSFTTKIQKIITLSDTHDGFNITCSAKYPVNEGPAKTVKTVKTAKTVKTLSVSYAPKITSASISPSGLVSAGSLVMMTCSSRAKPAVINFSWFRSSKHGDVKVAEGETYSLNATEGGDYYCVATNDLGNQTSPKIKLIVGDNPNLKYILGGAAVIIILISLIVCIWCFKKVQRQQQQKPVSELELQNPAPKTEDDLHYGEVTFRQRSNVSSASRQVKSQEQDSVYAEVKVSQGGNCSTQAADKAEDIYAQVKKK